MTERIEDVPADKRVDHYKGQPVQNARPVPKVYAAISAVQAQLAVEGIAKDSKNAQQGYNFRGIDAVYNALSPILALHKLCILPRILKREVVERESAQGKALFYVTVEAEFDLVAAEDGSKHTIRTFGEAMDSADKATNKAMSAAYKYAAMQAFAIPTQGDNDADATTHDVKPTQQFQRPVDSALRGETIPDERKAELSQAASQLTDLVTAEASEGADNEWKIWDIYEPVTDQEEKTFLWSLLSSKIRTRITAIGTKKKAEANPKEPSTGLKRHVTRAMPVQ
jgi:hypothetical protein